MQSAINPMTTPIPAPASLPGAAPAHFEGAAQAPFADLFTDAVGQMNQLEGKRTPPCLASSRARGWMCIRR